MTGEIKISVRAYAKQLNVNESAVRKAIDAGKIKKGYDKKTKKITASVANREWGFIHLNPKPQRGVSKAKVIEKLNKKTAEKKDAKKIDLPNDGNKNIFFTEKDYSYTELIQEIKIHPELAYNEAVRRKEILGIAMDKMKIEEMQGTLVKKSEVEKALFAMGDQLKKLLLNIPSRSIDHILTAPNKVEASNILLLELTQVLNSFEQLNN